APHLTAETGNPPFATIVLNITPPKTLDCARAEWAEMERGLHSMRQRSCFRFFSVLHSRCAVSASFICCSIVVLALLWIPVHAAATTCTPGTANPSVTVCMPTQNAIVSTPTHVVAST